MTSFAHDIKWIIIITVLILILALFWHFIYDISDKNHSVGYIAPINTSVWEQLKTYIFPIIIAFFIIYLFNRRIVTRNGGSEGGNVWLAVAAVIQLSLAVVIVSYYTYTGALTGQRNMLIDIMIYIVVAFVAAAIGWFILTRIRYEKKITYTIVELQSLAAAITPVVWFVFLTYAPGPVPIFKPT